MVASPLTSPEELFYSAGLFGWPFAIAFFVSSILLGLVGGIFSALKSFAKGEISELTSLVHDAREHALDRLKAGADSIGAEEVVGVKTYIIEIGQGLIEFMAIGTAVRKATGMATATQSAAAARGIRRRGDGIGRSLAGTVAVQMPVYATVSVHVAVYTPAGVPVGGVTEPPTQK